MLCNGAVNAVLSRKGLRMLYFLYLHSIISYRIIFRCNTPNSIKIFRLQKKKKKKKKKKDLRIMNKATTMDSYRELLKLMKILPLYSQYIFSLLMCGEQQTFIYKKLRSP